MSGLTLLCCVPIKNAFAILSEVLAAELECERLDKEYEDAAAEAKAASRELEAVVVPMYIPNLEAVVVVRQPRAHIAIFSLTL